MPIFRRGRGPHALPVAMSGVRMGERLLWIGAQELGVLTEVLGAMAVIGVNGRTAAVARNQSDGERLQIAAGKAGVELDLEVAAAPALPFETAAFDVVILAGPVGVIESLPGPARSELLEGAYRVLRPGGRFIVMERYGQRRFFGLLAPRDVTTSTSHETEAALQAAGFRPVRTLARRQGMMFVEGLRRQDRG